MMKERQVKSLVVERQHAHDAYGMLSYRELLDTVVAQDGDVDLLNVYDAATIPAITVNEDLSVRQAAALMSRYHLSRLVVVESNQLVGLLAMNDILARLMEELTGRDLASARDRIEFWLALRGRELVAPR